MARLFWLVLAVAIMAGCAEDIVVEPPQSLRGVYDGEYIVTRDYGSSGGGTTVSQWVVWTFSDQKFWMEATKTDQRPKVFCDMSGNYKLETNITLSDPNTGGDQCDPRDVPEGTFGLRRTIGADNQIDSLYLEQIEGTMKKELRLKKKPQ